MVPEPSFVQSRALRLFSPARVRAPTPKEIAVEVAARYGMTFEELLTRTRAPRVSHPRQEAMAELRKRTKLSAPQIARLLGLKDHTTVLAGIRAHEKRLASA